MDAEHVQRVIGAEDALEVVDAPQADHASQQADHQAAHQADEAGRRGDGHQAGHRTRCCTQHRRLALQDPFSEGPRHHGTSGCQQGVAEGQRSRAIGLERGTGVETEPAHPQQRRTDHSQRQRVRRHRFAAQANTLADDVGTHQAGDRGIDVDHGAACEVERAFLEQPARDSGRLFSGSGIGERIRTRPEPDHVRDRQIREGEPQDHEQHHGRELDALGEGADDQAAGDRCEGRLEARKHQLGDVDALAEGRARGFDGHALHEQAIEAAEECAAFSERERVAVDEPQHDDQREDHHHLHQHRQHVLRADQAAVEQGEARDRHHDDQQRGHDHPGGVALVRHRCRSRRCSVGSRGCFSSCSRCGGRCSCRRGRCRSSGRRCRIFCRSDRRETDREQQQAGARKASKPFFHVESP